MIKNTLLLFILFTATTTATFANQYEIPEIRVAITIKPDGLIEVEEQRKYIFDGSFSWADYRLPKRGFGEIKNIRVSEGSEAFINKNTKQEGTFNVSENENSVVVKWHYNALDEERTFTISYELTDALVIGDEWSEFFWNYLASGREKSTNYFEAEINLPDSSDPTELYSWNRGFEQTEINHYDNRYSVIARNIPRNRSVQVRLIFPTGLFDQPGAKMNDPDFGLEQVLEEEREREEKLARKAERDAFYKSILFESTLLISLFSLGIFLLIYRKYGKRFSAGIVSNRETIVIPDDTPPALAGRLLFSGYASGNHFVATIFDLARRGWYQIKEQKKEPTFFSSKKNEFIILTPENRSTKIVTDWEQMVIDFIDLQLSEGNRFIKEITEQSSRGLNPWYTRWNKRVKEAYEEQNWIDKTSFNGVYLNASFQFILVLFAVFLLIRGGSTALIALFTSSIFLIASFAIVRRTKKGEKIYRRWNAYRKGLKTADKRTIRMEFLDRHFIYAVAFQLSENQLKTLIESTEKGGSISNIPWIILLPGSSSSPASAASSLTTLSASGSSSFSGVSGSSGATAGSSGGGASGGAG